MEHFEITSEDAILTNNNKTIAENDDFNCNGYGSHMIMCKNNSNTYEWKIKIDSLLDIVYIGVDDGNAHHTDTYDCFAHKKTTNNYCYAYDGYIHCLGKELIGNLPRIKTNDVLSVQLCLKNKTLTFLLNNKLIYIINDIIATQDQKYRLAVYVSRACVSIIHFNIKQNGNNEKRKEQKESKQQCTQNCNDNGLMSEDLLDMFLQLQNACVEQKINVLDNENKEKKEEKEEEKLFKEVNTTEYKQWDENEVIQWILSIENGVFIAFEDEIKHDIIKNQIKGKDLIHFNKHNLKKFAFVEFVGIDVFQKNINQLIQKK